MATEREKPNHRNAASPPADHPQYRDQLQRHQRQQKGITVNLRTEKGLDLIKRLVAVSDVVVENFSARALQSWGLGYEELCKLKPDIVYVSQSGFGHTGRHRSYLTMGPIAQAFSGLTFLSGLPGEPPAGWGWSYLDDTGGMYIAFSTLTSLYRRNVTGQGQHVDLSQMIVGATLNGSALLDATVNGRPSQREGYPLETGPIGLGPQWSTTTAGRPLLLITPTGPRAAATTIGAPSRASPRSSSAVWWR